MYGDILSVCLLQVDEERRQADRLRREVDRLRQELDREKVRQAGTTHNSWDITARGNRQNDRTFPYS